MGNQQSADFTFQDALILDCIRSRRHGATIVDILGQQDMVERSYSTCDELDKALRRYMAMGYITRNRNRFTPTESLLGWPTDAATTANTIRDIVLQLQAQLNAESAKRGIGEMTLPEPVLDEDTYQQALKRHYRSSLLTILVSIGGIVLIAGIAVALVIRYLSL